MRSWSNTALVEKDGLNYYLFLECYGTFINLVKEQSFAMLDTIQIKPKTWSLLPYILMTIDKFYGCKPSR